MTRTIFFDLDGTLVDFYGVTNWLDDLINERTRPYEIAEPLIRFSLLARMLNKIQREGYRIGVISWLSRGGSVEFNERITEVKLDYLSRRLPSVTFDEIHIVPYGTPKEQFSSGFDILFDDEEKNRKNWIGEAFTPDEILEILKGLN